MTCFCGVTVVYDLEFSILQKMFLCASDVKINVLFLRDYSLKHLKFQPFRFHVLEVKFEIILIGNCTEKILVELS